MSTLDQFVKIEPWQHQRDAFEFLQGREYGALFADMGTGKSLVQIGLMGLSPAGHWLVVCPLAMVEVWAREIRKFAGYPVEVVPLTGPTKERAKALTQSRTQNRVIYITNYESLTQKAFWDEIQNHPWLGIALDESHRIKSGTSQTTKKLTALGKSVRYRNILTGTPAADKPIDVFSQYRFLNESIFGPYFTHFRARYTIGGDRVTKTGQRYYEILGYQNLPELNERIYQHAFRVTNEVLDLPEEPLDVVIDFELTPKEERFYASMMKQSLVELDNEDEFSSAANVLARLLRLQQVTSGFLQPDEIPGEPRPKVQEIGDSKRRVLQSILEDIEPEPVVVFYRFKQDAVSIKTACDRTGRLYYELSGSRHELDDWKSSGIPNRVLAVQIKAGGAGVSTVEAAKVIYYSNTYSLTDYQQSRARSYRPGQDRRVTYYHLLAKNTIDEVIKDALDTKEVTVKYLIDRLRGS